MTESDAPFRSRPVTSEDIRALRRFVGEAFRLADTLSDGLPFLLLTPLGMSRRSALARMLAERGIGIGRIVPVPDYRRVSSVLYTRAVTEERMRVALKFEELWGSLFPDPEVECWEIPDPDHHERLLREKRALRDRLESRIIRGISTKLPPSGPPTEWIVPLRAFHMADREDWGLESRLLQASLRALAG